MDEISKETRCEYANEWRAILGKFESISIWGIKKKNRRDNGNVRSHWRNRLRRKYAPISAHLQFYSIHFETVTRGNSLQRPRVASHFEIFEILWTGFTNTIISSNKPQQHLLDIVAAPDTETCLRCIPIAFVRFFCRSWPLSSCSLLYLHLHYRAAAYRIFTLTLYLFHFAHCARLTFAWRLVCVLVCGAECTLHTHITLHSIFPIQACTMRVHSLQRRLCECV